MAEAMIVWYSSDLTTQCLLPCDVRFNTAEGVGKKPCTIHDHVQVMHEKD
jgi:hypothetical protein